MSATPLMLRSSAESRRSRCALRECAKARRKDLRYLDYDGTLPPGGESRGAGAPEPVATMHDGETRMIVGPTLDSMRHRGHCLQLQHRPTVPHGVLPPAEAITLRAANTTSAALSTLDTRSMRTP